LIPNSAEIGRWEKAPALQYSCDRLVIARIGSSCNVLGEMRGPVNRVLSRRRRRRDERGVVMYEGLRDW